MKYNVIVVDEVRYNGLEMGRAMEIAERFFNRGCPYVAVVELSGKILCEYEN
jgi:hypothetical protein